MKSCVGRDSAIPSPPQLPPGTPRRDLTPLVLGLACFLDTMGRPYFQAIPSPRCPFFPLHLANSYLAVSTAQETSPGKSSVVAAAWWYQTLCLGAFVGIMETKNWMSGAHPRLPPCVYNAVRMQ